MIEAMGHAIEGMHRATNQADDAAKRILRATGESFTVPDDNNDGNASTTNSATPDTGNIVKTSTRNLVSTGNNSLISDIVDLKTSEHTFKANAIAYKKAAAMTDELLKAFDKK